jgi:hypothetical protein
VNHQAENRVREICQHGSEGGGPEPNRASLPLINLKFERLVRTAVGPFTRSDSIPLDVISSGRIDAAPASLPALLPALAAVPRLPRVTLPETLLDVAIRGGLIDVPPVESRPSLALVPSTAQATAMPTAGEPPAVAACDAAGELVGILRPHASGCWRLRPNFQGLG